MCLILCERKVVVSLMPKPRTICALFPMPGITQQHAATSLCVWESVCLFGFMCLHHVPAFLFLFCFCLCPKNVHLGMGIGVVRQCMCSIWFPVRQDWWLAFFYHVRSAKECGSGFCFFVLFFSHFYFLTKYNKTDCCYMEVCSIV